MLIRNPDTSQVGSSIEYAPGSGAAGTDVCTLIRDFVKQGYPLKGTVPGQLQ